MSRGDWAIRSDRLGAKKSSGRGSRVVRKEGRSDMHGEIYWNTAADCWCYSHRGIYIACTSKSDIEAMLDRLDEQRERRDESRSIIYAVTFAAFLLGLAAVLAAWIGGRI
jgi:hypothetical protein